MQLWEDVVGKSDTYLRSVVEWNKTKAIDDHVMSKMLGELFDFCGCLSSACFVNCYLSVSVKPKMITLRIACS